MRDSVLLAASDAAKASGPWTTHDTRLVIAAVAGIALVVVLIAAFSVHPFLALVAGSALTGFAAGVGSQDVISNFEDGVGSTLMEVGLLIALGAMLGKLLAESGGADQVVDTLVSKSGNRLLPWTMGLVAAIVALPLFFEIGLVLMLPVIVLVTRRSGLPLMRIAIPTLAGLSVLHGLIPPHPGPLIAIGFIHAQLGITLAFGILVAIPTVAICGPLFSLLAARWVPVGPPDSAGGVELDSDAGSAAGGGSMSSDVKRPPSFAVTLATVLFPVILTLSKSLADIIWDDDAKQPARLVFDFIGEPLVALFLSVVLASITFGYAVGFDSKQISSRIGASLPPIAGILLIVGAGGGFKQTLIGAGVGDTIGKIANDAGVSVLLISWILAAAIRLATGSATVATTTAAGIVAPLVGGLGSVHLALIALAVGTGSLIFSHVNDAGFWLVNQSFKLTVGQTFKTWSVMETLISVIGFGFVSILWTVT